MERFPVLTVLILALVSDVIHGATKTFMVTWYDGREHVLSYNRTDYGDCLFTPSPSILMCMRNYKYKPISDIWRYDTELIYYISVSCQQQEYFSEHRHVCICKTASQSANPSSSKQHDEYSFCQVTKLVRNTFNELTRLEALDLSDNSIGSVDGESLKGLSALRFLDLGQNPLKSLPGGLLCDVPNLEVFSMENTMIKSFPAHVFDCGWTFTNLTYIDLSEGEISSIVPDSLKNIRNLKSLNLSCNALTRMPSRTFENAQSLEYLDLSRNDFKSFPEGICEPTDYLKHVQLNGNRLEILNMTNLQECTNMTFLDISFNQIREIIGNINRTMSVKHLNLSHNFIQDLHGNFLGNLANLTTLDLAKNEIHTIAPDAFQGLTSLLFLNISANLLSNSSSLGRVFHRIESLTELYLTNNALENITDGMFEPLVKLTVLDLSRTSLKTLSSQSFKGLVSLTNLSLAFNSIVSLPHAVFHNLGMLKLLDLSYNSFIHFDNIVLPSVPLNLNLSNNALVTFPNAAGNKRVTVLDIGSNSITTLSRIQMQNLESVKYLDLSENSISNIDEHAFEGLKQLETLILSHNQIIVNLSLDVFRGASKLVDLDLSYNNLTSVDFMFSFTTLDNVRTLSLAHNPVYGVTDMLNRPAKLPSPGLETLDLSYCVIRNVTSYAFKGFKNLGYIDLSNNLIKEFDPLETKVGAHFSFRRNPLVCTCVLAWIANPYVTVDGVQISTFDYAVETCLVYPKLFNVSIRALHREDFMCRTEVGCDSNCACFSRERNGPITTTVCTDGLESPPSLIPNTTVNLHLDGNKFTTLDTQLGGGASLKNLYLNISGVRAITLDVFINLEFLTLLDLSNNRLTDILPLTFQHQSQLQKLNLSQNFLTTIAQDTFKGLDHLYYLDLSDNEFQTLDSVSLIQLSQFQNRLYVLLGKNPYRCSCANADFRLWLDSHRVGDERDIECDDGREFKSVPERSFECLGMDSSSGSKKSSVIVAAIVTVVVLMVLGAAIFYYKRDLLAVLYTKLRIGCLRPRTDKSKPTDAFVVYNINDTKCSEWIRLMFMKKLERKRNYRFIFPDRVRLMQGVADLESHQLYDCKCAVFVVSSCFMNSNWACECFRKAWFYSQENNNFRIILVIFGDVDIGSLAPEMTQMLRKGNYVTARSRAVWDRLIYELPDPHSGNSRLNDDDVSESDVILYSPPKYQTLDDGDVTINT